MRIIACVRCSGEGEVARSERVDHWGNVDIDWMECPECHGEGEIVEQQVAS